jgi:putative transposase
VIAITDGNQCPRKNGWSTASAVHICAPLWSAALAAEVNMGIPHRGETSCSTYFITAGTFNKAYVLQSDRMCELFCKTLFQYRDEGKLKVHAFVVMPNHIHLLITVPEGMTLERVLQLVKGGFSYQAGKQFGIRAAIWQKSFVDRRVRDASECMNFKHYIHQNPVRAELVNKAEDFFFSSANSLFRLDELPQRLKPPALEEFVMHR